MHTWLRLCVRTACVCVCVSRTHVGLLVWYGATMGWTMEPCNLTPEMVGVTSSEMFSYENKITFSYMTYVHKGASCGGKRSRARARERFVRRAANP